VSFGTVEESAAMCERRENRARWYGFHLGMSELHARLAAEHAEKAERLCEDHEGFATDERRSDAG
jgi:hypothetical protein